MAGKPRRTRTFEASLDRALAKYPRSRDSVESTLEAIAANPGLGSRYPGFVEFQVFKARVALKEYGLSERKGLRVIYLVATSGSVVPILAYKKGEPAKEHEVKARAVRALKQIIEELQDPEGE